MRKGLVVILISLIVGVAFLENIYALEQLNHDCFTLRQTWQASKDITESKLLKLPYQKRFTVDLFKKIIEDDKYNVCEWEKKERDKTVKLIKTIEVLFLLSVEVAEEFREELRERFPGILGKDTKNIGDVLYDLLNYKFGQINKKN